MGKSLISCFSRWHCGRISKAPMKLMDPPHLLQRDWQCAFLMQSVENRPGLSYDCVRSSQEGQTRRRPPSIRYYGKSSLKLAKGLKTATEPPKPPKIRDSRTGNKRKCLKTLLPTKKEATHEESRQMHWYTHLLGAEGTLRHWTQWTSWFCYSTDGGPQSYLSAGFWRIKARECVHGLNVKERNERLGVSI